MKVAVIRGGRSSEHEISLRSGASVAAGLREAGHEVIEVLIERDGRWLAAGRRSSCAPPPACSAPTSRSRSSTARSARTARVQGTLETLDVAYAGPSVLAAAVAIDKLVCKRLLAFHGLPQVEFCEVGEEGWREQAAAMARPLWVKPSRLGSSVGITRGELARGRARRGGRAARLAHDPRVIIEADAGGREVECSVIGNTSLGAEHDTVEVSLPGAIVTKANEWYDFEAKYTAGRRWSSSSRRRSATTALATVRELAARVFRAIGGTGLARCDFFVRDSARCW